MKTQRIFICGTGIISPLGTGVDSTVQALQDNHSAIRPLDLFTIQQEESLPVGQADLPEAPSPALPRTHRLASEAAREAMVGHDQPPDAIVIGTTTGGMLSTELLLRNQASDTTLYRYHGLETVADQLAQEFHCTGPALTVSTACSSGAVAITLALNMLRSGQAETILVGGVDSLCRLTYYGFHSLQLVDRNGSRPLDTERNGMAVAEGAGMLLLSTIESKPAQAELLGGGLSCDAHHPAAPHPEGQGAYAAMKQALQDADLDPDQIDYINLHGTGTPDNDLAESKAVRRLFPHQPPLSSIKGATGHSLAAAGAIEAVLAVIAINEHLLPANTNLRQIDPRLGIQPVTEPGRHNIRAVLSNSFGFGGNNGSLVITRPNTFTRSTSLDVASHPCLAVHGYSCITGAGMTDTSLKQMHSGSTVAGMADITLISEQLPPRIIRRLKRLPQMTLALAQEAMREDAASSRHLDSVFMGTGWGALSETYDFLDRLTQTKEQFPSPTDFIGSVHNGPAGQAAIKFSSTGPNITASGGDYSFEQSVITAVNILSSQKTALLIGADEGHPVFSPLLDPSIPTGSALADGGAALVVSKDMRGALCTLSIPYFRTCITADWIEELTTSLLQVTSGNLSEYGLIMAGIPAVMEEEGEKQLKQFLEDSRLPVPVIRYRKQVGEFATASAVATALGVSFLESGTVPSSLTRGRETRLDSPENKILILGLGQQITAMELARP